MIVEKWMSPNIGDYYMFTSHMKTAEHGAYLLLCMHHETHGELPDSDVRLAEIARCDRRAWRGMKERIFALFSLPEGAPSPFKLRAMRSWDERRLPPNEWRLVRDEVFARDDYTCIYCGERGGRLECDHVIPISRGGGNEKSNLVTACMLCNRRKHARTVDEWLAA